MNTYHLTQSQILKGTVLVFFYVLAKTVVSQMYGLYDGFDSAVTMETVLVFGGMFLGCTVFLSFIGFRFWVGVPLGSWFSQRRQVVGDILWGFIAGVGIVAINIICFALFISFQLVPSSADEQTISVISYSLTLLFRFCITAPSEEIMFRGFLQQLGRQWFGPLGGIFLQALLYAVMYLGFYPLDMWFFILLPFLHGLVWGVLREKRGTLLSSLLGHSVAG